MANELQIPWTTGSTVYFLLRNSVGQVWNGSSFVAYNSADYADYDIPATEQGTSGYFVGDMPAVTAGVYYIVSKQQLGGSPAETDFNIGTGQIQWNGTVTLPLSNIAASGVPVNTVSGQFAIANSGLFVTVPIATISGNISNSGIFAAVPIATISGVIPASGWSTIATLYSGQSTLLYSGQFSGQPVSVGALSGLFTNASLNSGQTVLVYSGQLSGQPVNPLSGVTVPQSGLTFIASGPFVNVPISTLSGVIANSGLFVTVPTATISGVVAASGLFGFATLNSGQFTIPYSGSLSGQKVELFSGNVVDILSGQFVVASLNSGQFVNVYSGQLSGQPISVEALSGLFTNASLNSGQSVLVYSGQLSGQPVNPLSGVTIPQSGLTFPASGASVIAGSGVFAVVPPSTLSGVNIQSGAYATVLPANLSGVFANASLNSGQMTIPYSGSLSGQKVDLFSGNIVMELSGAFVVASLVSGQFVNVYSGQLSGQPISLLSGNSVLVYSGQLSGQQVIAQSILDKSGYSLAPLGLDPILVESGMNFRQAQAVIAASQGGQLSGVGTGTIRIAAANVSGGPNRILAGVSSGGNRLIVTLNLPS